MNSDTPGPRIITFGCRLNAYESEVMRGHARAGTGQEAFGPELFFVAEHLVDLGHGGI